MRSRFLADQSGGVAPMFALAIVPIIGLAGAAIDYSRASSARTAMFAALDATGLMLSRDAATMTQAQINAKATDIFNARVQPHRCDQRPGQRGAQQSAGRQLHAQCHGERQPAGDVHPHPRPESVCAEQQRGLQLGHQEARARARARQYRLDGPERQDRPAQDRGEEPAHHAEGGREAAGRREGVDHSLRHRW